MTTDQWNHNSHYHPLILGAVSEGAQLALDVGCGEGTLARQLGRVVPKVVAIDLHRASVDMAKAIGDGSHGHVDFVVGNFLTYPFEPPLFDFIASVATLHHMNATTALRRMSGLLRPGGTLAVVGLARSRSAVDIAFDVAGCAVNRLHLMTKDLWEHPSPMVWPPPETYGRMRGLAGGTLPGVRYRRHLLFRYSLIWTKPGP